MILTNALMLPASAPNCAQLLLFLLTITACLFAAQDHNRYHFEMQDSYLFDKMSARYEYM